MGGRSIIYSAAWNKNVKGGLHAADELYYFLKEMPTIVVEPRFDGKNIKYIPPSVDINAILPKNQNNSARLSVATSTVSTKSPPESPNVGEIPASANDEDGSHLEEQPKTICKLQPVKRGRGRPRGSKNKKTLEREAMMANAPQPVKRGRGRPRGSKNKKTLEREANLRKAVD